MIWTPDDPNPHAREPGLAKAEQRWLDTPTDDRPRRSATHTIRTATRRHGEAAVQTAAALINATVAVPPQQRRTLGQPRGTDTADPALAQIEATIAAVDRGLTRLGHLLDDCPVCPRRPQDPHVPGHNDRSTVTLGWLTGRRWTDVADHCTGISATSPRAVEAAATAAAKAHADGAADLAEQWMRARRDGAEPDQLDAWAHAANRLSLQVAALADSLGQWRAGPLVRRCAAGCGGAAPPKGEGATCRRCRKRDSRQTA